MKLPYKNGTPVRLVSGYGNRVDPITGQRGVPHGGYDLVSDGDKTICAVVPGEVIYSRMITDRTNRTWEWGNYICIRGDDSRLYYYCHLSVREVSAGERVREGDIIGVEGSTGRSTGSHLHFEVRTSAGAQINPADVIGVPNTEGKYIVADEKKEAETVEEDRKKEDEIMIEVNDKRMDDSEPQEWAREAVEWAVDNGIIYGNENGDLMLRQPCTREQMLVFLHRFAEHIGKA